MADTDMESHLDDLEHIRRQLRSMNDPITDDEMAKLVLQGVAVEFRGVVRMCDKDVRGGNVVELQEVLNTLHSEAKLDNQRKVVVATTAKDREPAKILQVAEQLQPGAKKREQHQPVSSRRKFKKKRREGPETRECFYCGRKGHLTKNCFALRAKKQKSKSMAFVRWGESRDESTDHGENAISMVMGADGSTLRDEWMIGT
ncbi:gag-polypeptide of LTR copia-type [Phytophthora infestans]|uniref:Gag-polypeptide of LTR copia-type n=1 Tax=Phytophthora infestans TaxID=4787 RepID=A0A8S9TRG8_PHYIN|nr:gag-polypeptide of LTR copia-type [Phytophthora infestans]